MTTGYYQGSKKMLVLVELKFPLMIWNVKDIIHKEWEVLFIYVLVFYEEGYELGV